METSTPTFDQLPHVVSGLSEKLDRVLDLLEKAGIASHSKQSKPSRRLVYAKEACQIIGKSLSTLYRAASSSTFMRMKSTRGLRVVANTRRLLLLPKPQRLSLPV